MINERHTNKYIEISIEDGILYGKYLVDKLDLQGAIKATEFRKKICGKRAFPALVDVSAFKEVSREARSYFAKEAGEDLKAIAVLIKNPVTRMLINFFMKFNQPNYPIRFFTAKREARIWLLQYVDPEHDKNARNKTSYTSI